MSLSGAALAELEAAAATLVDDAGRLGLGVAIVCAGAPEVTLGGRWLALEVPALQMVTAGWLLQVVAAGVAVTVRGCGEDACRGRGAELARLSGDVVAALAPSRRHLVIGPDARPPAGGRGPDARPPAGGSGPGARRGPDAGSGGAALDMSRRLAREAALPLHEPEATVQAMSVLGPTAGAWSFESPLAPLGEVVVDAGRCSACGCCLPACPTGAISAAERAGGGPFVLKFDASACSACGACVTSCPEGAVALHRSISSSSLAGGRRVLAEVARGDRCTSCGKPRRPGPAAAVVAARLAGSHPEIAGRLLRGEERCPDCLLSAPVGRSALRRQFVGEALGH
jgi:ferredoxin